MEMDGRGDIIIMGSSRYVTRSARLIAHRLHTSPQLVTFSPPHSSLTPRWRQRPSTSPNHRTGSQKFWIILRSSHIVKQRSSARLENYQCSAHQSTHRTRYTEYQPYLHADPVWVPLRMTSALVQSKTIRHKCCTGAGDGAP